MLNKDLEAVWDSQYGNDSDTALKDNNLFSLEIKAILAQLDLNTPNKKEIRVLELGCGTGQLLSKVGEHLKGRFGGQYLMVGVDFSRNAMAKAYSRELENARFECSSFSECLEKNKSAFDVVLTQRSIMAVMDAEEQERLLLKIRDTLTVEGVGIMSECFSKQFDRFNFLREDAGVPGIEKVWHSRHVDESALERIFNIVNYTDFCSTYMLITRLVYPLFENPKHNQFIHDLASRLPNSGDLSYLKIATVRR